MEKPSMGNAGPQPRHPPLRGGAIEVVDARVDVCHGGKQLDRIGAREEGRVGEDNAANLREYGGSTPQRSHEAVPRVEDILDSARRQLDSTPEEDRLVAEHVDERDVLPV